MLLMKMMDQEHLFVQIKIFLHQLILKIKIVMVLLMLVLIQLLLLLYLEIQLILPLHLMTALMMNVVILLDLCQYPVVDALVAYIKHYYEKVKKHKNVYSLEQKDVDKIMRLNKRRSSLFKYFVTIYQYLHIWFIFLV